MFPADEDVAHVQPLTKTDMISFYNNFISPSSTTKAKISVHLVAQSKPAAPQEEEQQTKAAATPTSTEVTVNEKEQGKHKPVLIKDLHAWKAGLQMSEGVKPVTDLEEFVEAGVKL